MKTHIFLHIRTHQIMNFPVVCSAFIITFFQLRMEQEEKYGKPWKRLGKTLNNYNLWRVSVSRSSAWWVYACFLSRFAFVKTFVWNILGSSWHDIISVFFMRASLKIFGWAQLKPKSFLHGNVKMLSSKPLILVKLERRLMTWINVILNVSEDISQILVSRLYF